MIKTIRIAVITACILFVFAKSVFAQTAVATDFVGTENATVVSEELDYTLPYPGILPDHPLYLFKILRDTLMQSFINNPVKRIEFFLLQSDKYLAMAMVYADMGKWDRAGKTIVQSQNEMERAIAQVVTTRAAGTSVPGHIVTNMERSTVKHKQRIDQMKILSKEPPGGVFEKASEAFSQLAAQASALREK